MKNVSDSGLRRALCLENNYTADSYYSFGDVQYDIFIEWKQSKLMKILI